MGVFLFFLLSPWGRRGMAWKPRFGGIIVMYRSTAGLFFFSENHMGRNVILCLMGSIPLNSFFAGMPESDNRLSLRKCSGLLSYRHV